MRSRSAQLATPARTLGCPRHLRGWEELPTSTVDRKGGARGMVSDWCLCRCTCLLLSTVRCVSWVVTIPVPLGGDSNDGGDPVPASSAREVRVVCARDLGWSNTHFIADPVGTGVCGTCMRMHVSTCAPRRTVHATNSRWVTDAARALPTSLRAPPIMIITGKNDLGYLSRNPTRRELHKRGGTLRTFQASSTSAETYCPPTRSANV